MTASLLLPESAMGVYVKETKRYKIDPFLNYSLFILNY